MKHALLLPLTVVMASPLFSCVGDIGGLSESENGSVSQRAEGGSLECHFYATLYSNRGSRVIKFKENEWSNILQQKTFPETFNGLAKVDHRLVALSFGGEFFELDLDSGAMDLVASALVNDSGHSSDGLVYASSGEKVVSFPSTPFEGTLDPTLVTELPKEAEFNWILDVVRVDNLLYITAVSSTNFSSGSVIYVKDLSDPNGSPVLLGEAGVRTPGIVAGANGNIYLLGQEGRLYSMNPLTGAATLIPGASFAMEGEKGFDLSSDCVERPKSVKKKYAANAKHDVQGQFVFVKEPKIVYNGVTYEVPIPYGVSNGGHGNAVGQFNTVCESLAAYVAQKNAEIKIQNGNLPIQNSQAKTRKELDAICKSADPSWKYADGDAVLSACQNIPGIALPFERALFDLEVPCE